MVTCPTDARLPRSSVEQEEARLREIGVLRQRAHALEAEVARREALEKELRRREEELQREREKLEAIARELEIANRSKDDFLATVSHELRTPLNAMLGWVRMLRAGGVPAEKRDRALETIERNADAQTQLIEDLLDVSRIISGKLRLEVRPLTLATVVENAIDAIRPAAQARGVTLQQRIDPTTGEILGDPERLQQVVWNLVANAVKFTPKGGSVEVTTRRVDASIEIVVLDSGQGIDPAFLPRIFERFRQADATPGRKHGGLGLGLAIARHLVELHGGSVKVASEGIGKGACFTVSLPVCASTSMDSLPALQLASHAPMPRNELEGVHVLVVEDEDDARELLAEMLGSCSARVTTASNVEDALRLVGEVSPDIVVSDIAMPGADGHDFVRRLRALPASEGGRTPAVALTAYARFEDRTKALLAGFNMHVPKPVEPAELIAVLANLKAMISRT